MGAAPARAAPRRLLSARNLALTALCSSSVRLNSWCPSGNATKYSEFAFVGKSAARRLSPPGEEIGPEVHDGIDQFFRFEEGEGVVDIDGVENRVEDGSGVIVPSGARHNVRNTGTVPLKLYSIYGPPEHLDGVVQATKAEADARHHNEEWDGKTSE